LAALIAQNPQLELYVPELLEASSDQIITEFIEAEPVVYIGMPPAEAMPRLNKLAEVLAELDRLKPYGELKYKGHFHYRDIRVNFPKWTEKSVAEGLMSKSQVDQINKILGSLIPYLQPRLTHGDLLPHSHALLLDNGKIALVDLENFSPEGMRYYDVANCYNRLFRYALTTDTPRRFLQHFLSRADRVKYREEQLMAAMLQRVVAMQYDAWYDLTHQGVDFRQRAAELLNLCLKNDLKELL
jgi:hypothetical protein